MLPILFASCNPTRYVPENETILSRSYIEVNKEKLNKSDIEPYIKQKPNKRIFGARFHLWLYNRSNIKKNNRYNLWLREIGEEPVIYDQYLTKKSTEQIKSFISSKGYFDSHVSDTVKTEKRESKVYYNVNLKKPYTIRNLIFESEDSTIKKLFFLDSANCLIEKGKPYDVDHLQAERSRFERFVREHGFYAFSDEHISFKIDSTIGNRQVDIYYGVKNSAKVNPNKTISYIPHSMYSVKNIYIYPDFVPRDALEGGEDYQKQLDTTYYRGYYFIGLPKKKPCIKYDLIIQSLYIKPGSVFNVTNTEQTQSHLLSLKVFRIVNIFYREVSGTNRSKETNRELNCNIQLTLLKQQAYKIELEGTNTAGDLGGAINLGYQHNNLFRGAEIFNLKLKGAYEVISRKDPGMNNTQEYGVEMSLKTPKFILPFIQKESFIKKYNPKTTFSQAYNYQNMPLYTRSMANATFGYRWIGNSYTTHIFNPIQFNFINLLSIDSAYHEKISTSSYLAYSYKDMMIIGNNYSFIYSNQKLKKSNNYWFFRFNTEAAGNILRLLGKPLKLKSKDGSYHAFGQPFAQYVRADIDLRYNVTFNEASSMVYRTFIGVGIPYGNSPAMPFEKQYFGGGANSIRGWQVRTLGPGSYIPDKADFLNQIGDIKLEGNIEYRFKLFWVLEGALFMDAGNVWSFNYDEARPGSQFKIDKFIDDIAVGTGLGLRFNFNFMLFRADLGLKLRDPQLTNKSKWILANRGINVRNDMAFVIAIGYPF